MTDYSIGLVWSGLSGLVWSGLSGLVWSGLSGLVWSGLVWSGPMPGHAWPLAFIVGFVVLPTLCTLYQG